MSRLVLKTHDGQEIFVSEEQAANIADQASMIVITDAVSGEKHYVSKGSIATIGRHYEPAGL